jgi:hypothetical protein
VLLVRNPRMVTGAPFLHAQIPTRCPLSDKCEQGLLKLVNASTSISHEQHEHPSDAWQSVIVFWRNEKYLGGNISEHSILLKEGICG